MIIDCHNHAGKGDRAIQYKLGLGLPNILIRPMRLDGKALTGLTPALLTGCPVPDHTTPTNTLNGWHGTSSLSSGVSVKFEVRGLRHDLHSGNSGGAVQDPLKALGEIIAKIHYANGRVSIPEFYGRSAASAPKERAYLRKVGPPGEKILADAAYGMARVVPTAARSSPSRKGRTP